LERIRVIKISKKMQENLKINQMVRTIKKKKRMQEKMRNLNKKMEKLNQKNLMTRISQWSSQKGKMRSLRKSEFVRLMQVYMFCALLYQIN